MTQPLNLTLDPDTERRLVDQINHDVSLGKFRFDHGSIFVLDSEAGDPGRSTLIKSLQEKLHFIDFDAGGVKVLNLNIHGNPAQFTLVPRWKLPPTGAKGFGGPSIALQFTLHW